MANKAVATKEDTNIVAFDASMFEQDAGKGMENISQEDLALPFLKILSGLDPLLDTLETARKGDIYNTVTGDVFKGKEGLKVIPCAYQRRFIEWSPRGVGNGAPVNMYTPDDKLPKTERSKDDNREYIVGGNGNYLDETHQHFVVIVGADGSASTALIAMNELKSVGEENSKGSWHSWDISLNGQVTDAALYSQARTFADSIMRGDVNVKHTDETVAPDSDSIPF